MSENREPKAFLCPSCGAPLESKEGAKRVKCDYCGNTIKIPQSRQVNDRVLKTSKLRERDKSEVVGSDQVPYEKKLKRQEGPLIFLLMVVFLFLVISLTTTSKPKYQPAPTQPIYVPPVPTNTIPPPSFAKHMLTFGSEGITPGKFVSAYSMTVSDKGNVYVAEEDGSRIHIFDPDGNVVSTISTGLDRNVTGIAVRPDGQILLMHSFEIHSYDMEGRETGVMEDQWFEGGVIAPNGLLYTVSIDHAISRYDQNGKIDMQVMDTFQKYASTAEMISELAVDGLGNMYLLGFENGQVLKFSEDGTFLDKFGGKANTDAFIPTKTGNSPGLWAIIPTKQPGTFKWPTAIVVDDYGRVYVCDTYDISVFDTDTLYVGSFQITSGSCRGMGFDRQNHLFILTDENTVEKFEVPAP